MRVRHIRPEGPGSGQLHRLLQLIRSEGKVAFTLMCDQLEPFDLEPHSSLFNQTRSADVLIVAGLESSPVSRREELLFKVMLLKFLKVLSAM